MQQNLQFPSWDHSKATRAEYRQREAERSALYQIVYQFRDELEYCWDEQFRQQYGFLRSSTLEALDKFLNCGILLHGAARAHCEQCKHSILIPFSCKRRGLCPSCDTKRSYIFAEHLIEHVIGDRSVRHLVFTIPKRLRVYFRFDRKLIKLIYAAAWRTIQNYCPGAIMALHTAGDLLNFHPHIHAIALDGEFPPEISKLLEQQFAENIFAALLKKELISEELVDSMQAWSHSGFNVFVGDTVSPKEKDKQLFLARYLKKAPLSLERIEIVKDSPTPLVRYYKDRNNPEVYREFSPLEFLAELQQHIPDKWEQTTRYYGQLSASTRGAEKKRLRWKKLLSQEGTLEELPETKKPASRNWATLIKQVYEIDPLKCPRCGESMKIVAFVQDSKEITKICENLGIQPWRAPPKLPCKQLEIELD